MNKTAFMKIVSKLPGLTPTGFISTFHHDYLKKRSELENRAIYLQQTIDAYHYLCKFTKSKIMTKWQKFNCTPSKIQGLVEWNAGREVLPGPIIVAAVYAGFDLHYSGLGDPCFNIFARQLEGELRDYRVREIIKRAVG